MATKTCPDELFSYELGDPFIAGRGEGYDSFLSIAIDGEKNTGYALQYTPAFDASLYTIFPFDTKTKKMGTPITSPLFEGAAVLTLDAPRRTLWVVSATDSDGPILVPIDLEKTPPEIGKPISTSVVQAQQFSDFEVYPGAKVGYAVISKGNGEPSDIVPVDLVAHTFGDPISIGRGFANNIAFDVRNSRAYVIAENGKIVSIDLLNKNPSDQISLSAQALDIVIDNIDRRAYVLTYVPPQTPFGPANAGQYCVEPFDLDSHAPGEPIPVGSDIPMADSPSMARMAIDETLHSVYVTANVSSDGTAALKVINTLTNTVCPPISLSDDDPIYVVEMPIGVDPVAHTVYIGSGGSWMVPVHPSATRVHITFPAAGSTVRTGVPLTIAGTGEPGATVRTKLVYDGGNARHLPDAVVRADGTWETSAGTPKVTTQTYVGVVATQSVANLAPSIERSHFNIA